MDDRKSRINQRAEEIAEKRYRKVLDELDQEALVDVYEEAEVLDEEEQMLKAEVYEGG